MKNIRSAFLFAIVLALPNAWSAEEIVIGNIFSIGGPTAGLSTPYILALDHAVKEINESGGVLGKKLRIEHRNDKGSPSLAGSLAEELIAKDKVDFLMGGVDTGFCTAISEVAQKNKMIYVISYCQSPRLTQELFNPYILRATSATTQYIRATAKYAAKRFKGVNKWVTISNPNDYGKTVTKDFAEQMKKENPNFKIVAEIAPMTAETDMSEYVAAVNAAGAEAIFSGLWGTQSINFIKQATPFGIFKKLKYVGNTTGTPEEIKGIGQDVIEGGVGPTNLWGMKDFEKTHPTFPAWAKKFAAVSPVDPSISTDFAYRAVYGLVAAIKEAKSTKPDDVIKVLNKGYKFSLPWAETTMRGCDHQAMVPVAVGYTQKNAEKKKGEFVVEEVYNGADFWPSCEAVKKLQTK